MHCDDDDAAGNGADHDSHALASTQSYSTNANTYVQVYDSQLLPLGGFISAQY
jgi:hypothetical protein